MHYPLLKDIFHTAALCRRNMHFAPQVTDIDGRRPPPSSVLAPYLDVAQAATLCTVRRLFSPDLP
ncbi:hypothetical protein J6590_075602 [Homalodisca vitripennis]|nr:hypothetical protein J6590_075602 [Homalodisca vitripennis]